LEERKKKTKAGGVPQFLSSVGYRVKVCIYSNSGQVKLKIHDWNDCFSLLGTQQWEGTRKSENI